MRARARERVALSPELRFGTLSLALPASLELRLPCIPVPLFPVICSFLRYSAGASREVPEETPAEAPANAGTSPVL